VASKATLTDAAAMFVPKTTTVALFSESVPAADLCWPHLAYTRTVLFIAPSPSTANTVGA
jgi:hypothetical protein